MFHSDLLQTDFPTRGTVVGRRGDKAYASGHGRIKSATRFPHEEDAKSVLVGISSEDYTDLLEKFDTPRLTTFEAEEGDFDMGSFVKNTRWRSVCRTAALPNDSRSIPSSARSWRDRRQGRQSQG